MAVVERVGEHLLYAVLLQGFVATATGLINLLGSHAPLVEKGGDVLETRFVLGVQGRAYAARIQAVIR